MLLQLQDYGTSLWQLYRETKQFLIRLEGAPMTGYGPTRTGESLSYWSAGSRGTPSIVMRCISRRSPW
jgi:hypothetical protein